MKKENIKQIKENELENVSGGKKGPVDEIIHPSVPTSEEETESISSPLSSNNNNHRRINPWVSGGNYENER